MVLYSFAFLTSVKATDSKFSYFFSADPSVIVFFLAIIRLGGLPF